MALEPETKAATSFATAMPRFATSATTTVITLSDPGRGGGAPVMPPILPTPGKDSGRPVAAGRGGCHLVGFGSGGQAPLGRLNGSAGSRSASAEDDRRQAAEDQGRGADQLQGHVFT